MLCQVAHLSHSLCSWNVLPFRLHFRQGAQTRKGHQETLQATVLQLWQCWTTPRKWFHPKFGTGCLPRMSLQKTGAFHVDDATPTSAEAIQKYFADERKIHFIHAASPHLRPPRLATKGSWWHHQICPSSGNLWSNVWKNRLFWLFGLFTWIVDRDYMHTLPCYAVPHKKVTIQWNDCAILDSKMRFKKLRRNMAAYRDLDSSQV